MNYMPSVKYMHIQRRLPLTIAVCKRCGEKFRYYRRGRHRYFCGEVCLAGERKDNNDFFNDMARAKRIAARENAAQAHAAAEREYA
jgi:hypothetical protein